MTRIHRWGLAAFLSATITGAVTAADEPVAGPKAASVRPWYQRWLSADKPESTAKGNAMPARPSIILAPLSPEVLSEAVRAEEAACTRRLDACAKLRQVAIDKNDEKLLGQIDEMERQAIELSQQRIARLGVRGSNRASTRVAMEKDLGASQTPISVAAPRPDTRPSTAAATAPGGNR